MFIFLISVAMPIGLQSAASNDGIPFATNPDLNQMINATVTYASGALACKNSLQEIKAGKRMAVRILEHAKKYGLLTENGEWA